MYNQSETQSLKIVTRQFLSLTNSDVAKNEIDELKNVLRFHEYQYYVLSNSLITDFEYDQLYKLLESTEKIIQNLYQKTLLHNE